MRQAFLFSWSTKMAMTIYQKLAEIQRRVTSIQKTGEMTFGNRYKYASSSDVLEPVRKAMVEVGLILIPRIKRMEVKENATKDSKGNDKKTFLTILDIEYTWINVDTPAETISCEWAGQGFDDFEKGIGKALTYAQKYFLTQALMLPRDDEDPDGDTHDNYNHSSSQYPSNNGYQQQTSQYNSNHQPQQTTNNNGNKLPVNGNMPPANEANKATQLRNQCVQFIGIYQLSSELQKQLFASVKPDATMLSQIPDTQLASLNAILEHAASAHDPIEDIQSSIKRTMLYTEIRNCKEILSKSGKFTQEQIDALIAEHSKGANSTTLANDVLQKIAESLQKKIETTDIKPEKKNE